MRWRKLGRIFCPRGEQPWMVSHASNCVALPVDGGRHRIYFTSRDVARRGSIGWLEIDLQRPLEVLAVSRDPVLTPGPPGAFDDSGASLGCIVRSADALLLYYTGWNLGVTVPWRNSIGLAVSRDGLSFERVSPAPVLDRNAHDPFSLSYPFVMRDRSEWRMWYGSNLRWGKSERDMDHVIKYARGSAPDAWSPTGDICIGIEQGGEYAFSRPCVVRDGDRWRMWYSFRGAGYRIGYAQSDDGIRWSRLDAEAGIDVGREGWDAASVEYPWVFDDGGQRFMLYNGNDYGASGFGIAVLESD